MFVVMRLNDDDDDEEYHPNRVIRFRGYRVGEIDTEMVV